MNWNLLKTKQKSESEIPFLAFPPGLAFGGAMAMTLRRLRVWNCRDVLGFEENKLLMLMGEPQSEEES